MRFSRSFCLLLTEFFLSIRTEISVRSLPLCKILQIFTVNFPRYFRSKYKFCKIFEGTRSLNLYLREPGVLARARAISGPGRERQETISSNLNIYLLIIIEIQIPQEPSRTRKASLPYNDSEQLFPEVKVDSEQLFTEVEVNKPGFWPTLRWIITSTYTNQWISEVKNAIFLFLCRILKFVNRLFRVSVTISASLVKFTRRIMLKNKTLPWKALKPNFVALFVLVGMAFSFISGTNRDAMLSISCANQDIPGYSKIGNQSERAKI